MAEFEQGNIDTSFEDLIIAQKTGVRQRALAVRAFMELTEATNGEATLEIVNQIRDLTGDEAKKFRKAFTKATRLLDKVTPEIEEGQNEELTVSVLAEPELAFEPEIVEPKATEIVIETVPEAVEAEPETDEIQKEEAPAVEKSEAEGTLETKLPNSALRWLSGMVEDVESLTVEDIPRITQELFELRGPLRSNSRIDYYLLVAARLEGKSNVELAAIVGSTPGSIGQTLKNFKNAIVAKRNVSPETAVTEEMTTDVKHEPATETEPLAELTTEPESQPEIPVAEEARPIPHPPKNPAQIKRIVTEKVVEIEAAAAVEPIDLQETLQLAFEKPSLVSVDEWAQAAEVQIKDLASKHDLSQEEVMALWNRIHLDDKDEYRNATDAFKSTLDKLRPHFKSVVAQRFERDSPGRVILAMFFNNAMGYKSLDDMFEMLHKKDSSITKNTTQRQLVLAVSELLHL